jgi:hypothetical protein
MSKYMSARDSVLDRVESLGFDMRDNHMDGFFQFGAKQNLYKILWAVEKELKDAPSFYSEEEWLKENGR